MKILTINTHSIVEKDYRKKLGYFVEGILNHAPDIVAMQEVNQSSDAEEVSFPTGYVPCGSVAVKRDNHALSVVKLLRDRGMEYYWTWEGIKKGYEIYDEGLAILSRYPIKETKSFYVSSLRDYGNWKTRKILGIDTSYGKFYTAHMGWWGDSEEPFGDQWKRAQAYFCNKKKAWLMGDFNSPDDVRGEGYDMISESGWRDVYTLAEERDDGYSVEQKIDGWDNSRKMRIDYIWCNYDAKVKSAKVIFDGKNEKNVSDHYGVIAEIK